MLSTVDVCIMLSTVGAGIDDLLIMISTVDVCIMLSTVDVGIDDLLIMLSAVDVCITGVSILQGNLNYSPALNIVCQILPQVFNFKVEGAS